MPNLSPEQLQAVASLASGLSTEQVAEQIGKSARTIQRWLLKPDFARAVEEIRNRATNQVVEQTAQRSAQTTIDAATEIRALIPSSLAFLGELIANPEARNSDRLRAVAIVGNWTGLQKNSWYRLNHPSLCDEARLKKEVEDEIAMDEAVERGVLRQIVKQIRRLGLNPRDVLWYLRKKGREVNSTTLLEFISSPKEIEDCRKSPPEPVPSPKLMTPLQEELARLKAESRLFSRGVSVVEDVVDSGDEEE